MNFTPFLNTALSSPTSAGHVTTTRWRLKLNKKVNNASGLVMCDRCALKLRCLPFPQELESRSRAVGREFRRDCELGVDKQEHPNERASCAFHCRTFNQQQNASSALKMTSGFSIIELIIKDLIKFRWRLLMFCFILQLFFERAKDYFPRLVQTEKINNQ